MSIVKRITIREIAAKLGVSHVTVSLALRGKSRISKRRQEEVLKMAREMGYRPDPMLSSLIVYRHRKQSSQIHSVLAWLNHWGNPEDLRKIREFNAYWTGACSAAERFGYRLDEFVWRPDFTPKRLETILETRNIRGVLIPPHPTQPDWGDFHWDNFSVIRFGLSVRSPDTHVVTSDHMRSVITAVEKIHSYGYKRIGFVVQGDFDLRLGGSWTGGFYAAQKLLNLPHPLPLFITDGSLPLPVYRLRFKRWYDKSKPDAILTSDLRLMPTLEHFKIRVPHDVAVAATTVVDIPVGAGINQNSEEIGRVAVETLISLITTNDQGKPAVPRRILIRGTWVDGKSLPISAQGKDEQGDRLPRQVNARPRLSNADC